MKSNNLQSENKLEMGKRLELNILSKETFKLSSKNWKETFSKLLVTRKMPIETTMEGLDFLVEESAIQYQGLGLSAPSGS